MQKREIYQVVARLMGVKQMGIVQPSFHNRPGKKKRYSLDIDTTPYKNIDLIKYLSVKLKMEKRFSSLPGTH